MKELLKILLELQSIEFSETQPHNTEARLADLRAKVPPQILGHYDRLVARGKKGVAAVRHQTCTACHMSVPLGTVMTLRHGDDVQLCGNCGRYLYLDETPEPVVEAPKKITRRRKSKQLTPA
ncbi:MAG TPA: C4-type zinc ribbon domain-containing protein [Verrucomicrobiae bacterium]|nr:C4-type zinc ribbon domain-containing protein [Verrucomicrobiae bacterium]